MTGSAKKRYMRTTLTRIIKKVIRIISRALMKLESIPETAGPIRNAIPKEAPMYHIFFMRSVGVEMSAI